MTARTTGRQPGPGRSPGPRGTSKRPARRPTLTATAATTSTDGTDEITDENVTGDITGGTTDTAGEGVVLTIVRSDEPVDEATDETDETDETDDGTSGAVTGSPADDVTEETDEDGAGAPAEVTDAHEVGEEETGAADGTDAAAGVATEVADDEVVIDLTAVEAGEQGGPAGVPPIDANVLLRAILTPPAGIEGGEGLTDALTGAVPTWRLDEEPIYLEVIRDLGVPAVPEADGGTGEVIVGEVLVADAGS